MCMYVCVCMYVSRFLDASRMTRAMKDDSDKFFLRNRYAVWLWQTVT